MITLILKMPKNKIKKESAKQDRVHLSLLDREELLCCFERFHEKSQRGFQVRGFTITYANDLAKAFKISAAAVTKLWKLPSEKKQELHQAATQLRKLPPKKRKAASKRIRLQVSVSFFFFCGSFRSCGVGCWAASPISGVAGWVVYLDCSIARLECDCY